MRKREPKRGRKQKRKIKTAILAFIVLTICSLASISKAF